MINRRFLLELSCTTAALAVSLALAGCADDVCKVGDNQCLSGTLIRTCIKNDDGDPTWKVYPCGTGTSCVAVEPSAEADEQPQAADAGAADAGEGPADPDAPSASGLEDDMCVGICQDGVAECITPELSRYCFGGTQWVPDACGVGESCVEATGRCRVAGADEAETVKVCTPGETACVSDTVEKTCDADGSDWRLQSCLPWESCVQSDTGGECQVDPEASCDTSGGANSTFCLDAKTAARCTDRSGGYELVPCEGDTYCLNGRCRGENCAVGSTCVAAPPPQPDNPAPALPAQILTCTDGINQTVNECEIGQVCRRTDSDTAECVDPDCVVGNSVCGDANDDSVDATIYYSTCVTGATSGVPEWVLTQCEGNLVCDPTIGAIGAANLCRSECTPGAQVCANDAGSFVVSGWRECQADGTWGDITACTIDNAVQLMCMNRQDQDPGDSNQVVCADPVCAAVAASPLAPVNGVERKQGVCEGVQVRTCDDQGKLQETPEDCHTGVCRNANTTVLGDGHIRGICDGTVNCEPDESRCLTPGAGPLYQSCANGVWGTELVRCNRDRTCWDGVNAEGLRQVSCGGDCSPSSTRCDPEEIPSVNIQKCQDDGTWADQQNCELGLCQVVTVWDRTADGGNGANVSQAQCVLQCQPDREYCNTEGMPKLADDGLHTGWEQTRTCKSNGTWPDVSDSDDDEYFNDCSGVRACRVSGAGVHTGCIRCLGPEVAGGNEHGFADTTCEDDMFKACDTDNTWKDPENCGSGTTCWPPTAGYDVCGPCLSGAGAALSECSQTLLNDTEICGDCLSASGATVVCTNTNVNDDPFYCDTCAMPDMSTQVCTQTNITTYDDADTDAETCLSEGYGPAGFWGGEADCCSDAQEGSGTESCLSLYGYSYTSWGGEVDCCTAYTQGTTSTCYSLGYGFPGYWGTVVDCCSDYFDAIPAQNYAVCRE